MVAVAPAQHRRVLTLLIDNYDSYTYNIFQMLAEINGVAPVVVQNDAFGGDWTRAWAHFQRQAKQTQDQYNAKDPRASLELVCNVVISPGPGHPAVRDDFGMCADAIRRVAADTPVLGVCLGHQGLAHVYGGAVVNAPQVMHGRTSRIVVAETDAREPSLFAHVPSAFDVVRYHSLVVDPATVPPELVVTASTQDGVIMALQHREKSQFGVQFHPEAVCSTFGYQIFQNFRDATLGVTSSKCLLEHGDRRSPHEAVVVDSGVRSLDGVQQSPRPNYAVLIDRVATGLASLDFAQLVFTELFSGAERSFWLDSSNYVDRPGETVPQASRFSFMGDGTGPLAHCLEFSVLHKQLRVHNTDKTVDVTESADAMATLRDRLNMFKSHATERLDGSPTDDLPFSFRGGYVGYIGYELLENGLDDDSDASARVLQQHLECKQSEREYVPDMSLLFADRVVVVDHHAGCLYTLSVSGADETQASQAWHAQTAARLMELTRRSTVPPSSSPPRPTNTAPPVVFHPSRSRHQYIDDIAHVQQQIHDGETYEVCLTNQLRASVSIQDPLAFYHELRRRNPAPYAAFYLSNPDRHFQSRGEETALSPSPTTTPNSTMMERTYAVCCSSPERFLRVEHDGWMESKPIKGTRRRGRTSVEDKEISHELAHCEKDRAENMMIADLVRNDFGRVAQIGSVHVPTLMAVETYATVHQLVTTVRAKRSAHADVVDILQATFPGGSMTGAPKKRTMQLIRSLERHPRGVYSGALGFFSLDGSCDLNIIIRTALVTKQSATLGSGGAIVALSDCEDEYDEMLLKTRALVQAIGAFVTGRDDGTGATVSVATTATPHCL
jgi:para-aminobenzoate synthetase